VLPITRKRLMANALLFGIMATSPGLSFADEDTGTDASTENSYGIETGYTHESGKYGTRQETRSATVPLTAYYDTEHYGIEAMLPYMSITGPAGGIAGRVRHLISQPRPIVTAQGIADSTVSVTRDLLNSESAGLDWDLGTTIKFATGDVHRGLGTGANDYALFTDVSEMISQLTLTGTAGYTWYGSKGLVMVNGYMENLQFKDAAFGQLDGAVKLHEHTKIGLTCYAQQPTEGKIPEEESTAYLTIGLGNHVDLKLYALKGFTKASPNQGYGATMRADF